MVDISLAGYIFIKTLLGYYTKVLFCWLSIYFTRANAG